MGVKPSTHGKIRAILSEILASGQLFPALAGSLEGKLNSFCQLYLPAKPAIQPISARHHNDNVDEDGDFLLHDELRVSLDYLDTIFASGPLVTWFRVLPDPNPPSILLTDAPWESAPLLLHGRASIGAILFDSTAAMPLRLIYSSAEIPHTVLAQLAALRQQRHFIMPAEGLALAAPYFSDDYVPSLRHRSVIHFGDNQPMNSIATKGYSSALDAAHIALNLHRRLDFLRTRLWLSYVPSKANLSDLPSRGEHTILQAMGARRVPLRFPPIRAW